MCVSLSPLSFSLSPAPLPFCLTHCSFPRVLLAASSAVTHDVAECVSQLAHQPSLGLYHVQNHIRSSVPKLRKTKVCDSCCAPRCAALTPSNLTSCICVCVCVCVCVCGDRLCSGGNRDSKRGHCRFCVRPRALKHVSFGKQLNVSVCESKAEHL